MDVSNPVELGQNVNTDTSAALDVTLSGTIPTGALVMCAVVLTRTTTGHTVAPPTSVVGGGVTWALQETNDYDTGGTRRGAIYLYRAVASSPSGTTVTVTPSALIGVIQASVFYVNNAISENNGADAFLQSVNATGGATGGAGASASMATLTSATNQFLALGAYNGSGSRTFTPNASPAFTELVDFSGTLSGSSGGLQVQYATGVTATNPSVTFTLSGGADATGILVVEIAAAPVGPVITTQPTSQSAESGDNVTFTSAASTGTPQWQEDISGTPTNITGETTGAFTLNNVQLSDDGRIFRCAWTDGSGTTFSDWATLTVGEVDIPSTMPASDVNGDTDVSMTSTVAYDTTPGKFGVITGSINGVTFKDYFLPETP
jgi:hypothetical protein